MSGRNNDYWKRKWQDIPLTNIDNSINEVCMNCQKNITNNCPYCWLSNGTAQNANNRKLTPCRPNTQNQFVNNCTKYLLNYLVMKTKHNNKLSKMPLRGRTNDPFEKDGRTARDKIPFVEEGCVRDQYANVFHLYLGQEIYKKCCKYHSDKIQVNKKDLNELFDWYYRIVGCDDTVDDDDFDKFIDHKDDVEEHPITKQCTMLCEPLKKNCKKTITRGHICF